MVLSAYAPYAMPGTNLVYGAICLCAPYAIPGTDLACLPYGRLVLTRRRGLGGGEGTKCAGCSKELRQLRWYISTLPFPPLHANSQTG